MVARMWGYIDGNINWCTHCVKLYSGSSKKNKRTLYDSAIPLLSIYLKKTKIVTQKDTCTVIFIAALFSKAKMWKQPKCPPTDEWLRKM